MKQLEKRRSIRYDCQVPIESKKGSAFDQSQTVDISPGGIGFISNKAVPIDTTMAVEIALSSEREPVLVWGQVRWVRQIAKSDYYRVGMTFSKIASGLKSGLNQYFRKSA